MLKVMMDKRLPHLTFRIALLFRFLLFPFVFLTLSDVKPILKYIERCRLRVKMLYIHAYSVRCQSLYLSDA